MSSRDGGRRGPHQQDVRHDGPVHGQERLSEEDEDLGGKTITLYIHILFCNILL